MIAAISLYKRVDQYAKDLAISVAEICLRISYSIIVAAVRRQEAGSAELVAHQVKSFSAHEDGLTTFRRSRSRGSLDCRPRISDVLTMHDLKEGICFAKLCLALYAGNQPPAARLRVGWHGQDEGRRLQYICW